MTPVPDGADRFAANNKQLLFLVGVPRSGTTWLQSMLSAHPDIGTAQESHIFDHFITPMLKQWQQILAFDDGRGGIGLPAYLTESGFNRLLSGLVYEALSQADDFRTCKLFVEKTPDHLVHIEQIVQVLPAARFIYVERNPEDVIESLLAAARGWGHAWAPKSVFAAIRLCNDYRRQGLRAMEKLPQEKLLKVRYEDLCESPGKQLRTVLQFIGMDCDEGLLNIMVGNKAGISRYGEFARRNGREVQEPSGFNRDNKGRLSYFNKVLIGAFCR